MVDSIFSILNQINHQNIINKIHIAIFLFFLISFFESNAKANNVQSIAALDKVSHMANIQRTISNIFKCHKGFLIISFNLFLHLLHHNNISGKNATNKYP